jgi:hypothetical protein
MSIGLQPFNTGGGAVQIGGTNVISIDSSLDVTLTNRLKLEGSSSGATILTAPAAAGSPVVTMPTTTGTLALLADTIGGSGQTWQDVQSSRALNTTYTNSTGRPIMVIASFAEISQYVIYYAEINGISMEFGRSVFSGSNSYFALSVIVPNGNTYRFTGPDSVAAWLELR